MESFEPGYRDLYLSREREVSPAEKQRLFLLAGDLLLAGNSEIHKIVDPGVVYFDTNGFPAKYRKLEMSEAVDPKWTALKDVGVVRADLYFWPERATVAKKSSYPDQIDLRVNRTDNSADLYTMKLFSGVAPFRERPVGVAPFHVMIGNRREIHNMGVKWLEISHEDAATVSEILDTIKKTLSPGLAPQ